MAYSRQGLQEKAPMQLPLAVDETLLLLRSTIPTTIDVHKSISSDSRNRTVNVDISQVQECLVNLCNNAVHAMKEEGTLRISLETLELTQQDIPPQYESQPGLYAKLSVQDDGSGMPAETLDKIFDLFYTTKPVDEGTGVGLSTVQGIVKQHGGLIKVNSTLGEGSCFELYFPVTEQTLTTETASVNDDQPEGTERILFIDDDEMLANLGKEILTDKGYQVTSMTESTEALKLFSANPDSFKLVITDQTMPALCGKELIQKMLKIRPDMPTIICTGYSSKINEVEARQLGAGAFLMKPLDLPELLQTVRRVLDEKKAS
jgi:CheY-like chemotaxis protein